MKVVSFLASLMMVGVGAWARVYYRSIHDEIHGGNQQIQFATLDEYFYDDGNAFTSGSCSSRRECPPNYEPKEAVSSGVQSNPFLD